MATPAAQALVQDSAQEFLSGKLSHVDVEGIEKELKQLWTKAAADGGKTAATVMRACSFNIILLSADSDAESNCNDLLDQVLSARPGRGILAIYRPEKAHHLDAWVSARCHLEGSSKQICAEQITVCCEGGQPKELASVVSPLVIAELPVFIYWRSKIANDTLFQALSKTAARLVVDSQRDAFDLEQIKTVNNIIRTNRGSLMATDINWRRLSGWMRAMADAFDDFPMPADYLKKFKTVTITTGADANSKASSGGNNAVSAQSLLMMGWLASRLKWKPAGTLDNNELKVKTSSGESLTISFKSSREAEAGHIASIDCEFSDGRKLSVASEKSEELTYVVAQAVDSGHKEATRAHYDLSEATLLAAEIGLIGSDPIYEDSMESAAAALP